jgi:hypothetical protein
MRPDDLPLPALDASTSASGDLLSPLLQGEAQGLCLDPVAPLSGPVHGVIVGTLLALTDDGRTPLVGFPGQPGAVALRALSVVDLHGPHMGQGVVLMFDQGDVRRPIVMGVLRTGAGWPLPETPATVEVDADAQRMVVSARSQLVLRCGKASITLTEAGKVLIEGTHVSSRASGVNRLKGGSVQLN